jgi:hypothetical protein
MGLHLCTLHHYLPPLGVHLVTPASIFATLGALLDSFYDLKFFFDILGVCWGWLGYPKTIVFIGSIEDGLPLNVIFPT